MSQLIRIRRVSRGPRLSLLFSSRNTQERCKSSVVSTAQGREFWLLSKDEYDRHDRPDSIGSLRGASLANGEMEVWGVTGYSLYVVFPYTRSSPL